MDVLISKKRGVNLPKGKKGGGNLTKGKGEIITFFFFPLQQKVNVKFCIFVMLIHNSLQGI
jgi:hypothetical protein